jgi:hypothetical protein
MKRRSFLSLLLLISVSVCVALQTVTANAAWNPNRIIDDAIFDDVGSMNAGQIDSFLNSYPNSCISTNRGFSAPEPTGYSPSGGYTYGGNVSAGTVISRAAAAYDLNPRVLLVTLEKEQSLTRGNAGCTTKRYTAAMGYGCPDNITSHDYSGLNLYSINGVTVSSVSGTCVNSAAKAGFSQQVIRGAWLLKFGQQRSLGRTDWAIIRGSWNNSDDLNSCYSGPMTQGWRKVCPNSQPVYYDGYRSIDNTSVHMDTGATASMYWYTPHLHGNQNFVALYESWFGSTVIPNLSWDNRGYQIFDKNESVRLDPGYLAPGEEYIAKLHVVNTSNYTWTKTDLNPVLLGASNPQGRDSNLCHSSWLACGRPAGFQGVDSVPPGSAADFKFTFRAPFTPGDYREYFKPVAEMLAWAHDSSEPLGIRVVTGSYTWNNNGYKVMDKTKSRYEDPGNLTPGETYTAILSATNTGTATWSNTGATPVNLGTTNGDGRSSNLCNSAWPDCSRPARLQEASVAPGQTGHFEFKFSAPYRPGEYREFFKPLAEMVSWMNATSEPLGIRVPDPGTYTWATGGYKVLNQAESAFEDPGNLQAGQTYIAKLQAINTGTATWQQTGTTPFTLGTANPQGRNSILCHNSWLTCNRAVYLQESSVAPGQIGNFKFYFTAPAPGTYREYFKPLAEFMSWTNDIDEPLGIVVKP